MRCLEGVFSGSLEPLHNLLARAAVLLRTCFDLLRPASACQVPEPACRAGCQPVARTRQLRCVIALVRGDYSIHIDSIVT